MKKIFPFLFLFPFLAQAQLDTSLFWNAETPHLGIGTWESAQLPVTHSGGVQIIRTCDTIVPAEWGQRWAEGIVARPGRLDVRGYPQITYPSLRLPDCEAWETFTAWTAENKTKTVCNHEWVYAEWNEVNTLDIFTTLEMPPPCGKSRTENEARICRNCLRHETRVRTHGMKEVERKSQYQLLIEKIRDR